MQTTRVFRVRFTEKDRGGYGIERTSGATFDLKYKGNAGELAVQFNHVTVFKEK